LTGVKKGKKGRSSVTDAIPRRELVYGGGGREKTTTDVQKRGGLSSGMTEKCQQTVSSNPQLEKKRKTIIDTKKFGALMVSEGKYK